MKIDSILKRHGVLITFEGVDGAGKSSHIAPLARLLREGAAESSVLVTREPGGTPLAERIREMVLNTDMDPLTESLLVSAARRDHVRSVVEPALARGLTVICDRFADSTFAYQGGGAGVDLRKLQTLEEWVLGGLRPDLTLFFDVDPEIAARRRYGARLPDRFESNDLEFFARVRGAYLDRIASDPSRFATIDGTVAPEAVWKQVEAAVGAFRKRVESSPSAATADPIDTHPARLERGLSCSDGS